MKKIIIKQHHPDPIASSMQGQDTYVKGTPQQIAKYFENFLQKGYDWECGDLTRKGKYWTSAKIKLAENIKTTKSLINSLQKAVEVIQGACWSRDSYEIVEFVPEGAKIMDC